MIDWKLQKSSEWYWTLQKLIFSLPVNWFSSLRPSEAFSGRLLIAILHGHEFMLLAFSFYGQVYGNKYISFVSLCN